jgi:hypothetical protein
MGHKVTIPRIESDEKRSIEHKQSKPKRLYTIGAAFVAILLLFTSLNILISAQSPNIPTVIEPGSQVTGASFVIFVNDGTVYARYGTSGAIAYSSTNASNLLQTVFDSLTSGGLVIIKTDLLIDFKVQIRNPGIRIEGAGTGHLFGFPNLIWNSPLNSTMLEVIDNALWPTPKGGAGTQFENIILNGGGTCGILLQFNVTLGHALHNCRVDDMSFMNYLWVGMMLGNYNASLQNGQLANFYASNLNFRGGFDGITSGAIGIYSNAQNMEWGTFFNLNFDAAPGGEHKYHIYNRAGAWLIDGLLTTRSTVVAVYCADMMHISGWRAEENLLLLTAAADYGGSITIEALQHRWAEVGGLSGDSIVYNGINQPLVIIGARMGGNISIGGGVAREFQFIGVNFDQGTVNLGGPCLQNGTWSSKYGTIAHQDGYWQSVHYNATTITTGNTYVVVTHNLNVIGVFFSSWSETTNRTFQMTSVAPNSFTIIANETLLSDAVIHWRLEALTNLPIWPDGVWTFGICV